jgi:hypothetical protein
MENTRWLGARLVVIACVVTLTSSIASIADATTPGEEPSLGSAVTMDSQGWVHYTRSAAESLSLKDRKVVTIAGSMNSAGVCTFSQSGSVAPGSAARYSEEVAVNGRLCREQLVQGTITNTAAAALSAGASGDSSVMAVSSRVAGKTQVGDSSSARALAATATSSSSAYAKTGYIDPVKLTITSVSANLTWAHNGSGVPNASYRVVPYEFHYDGWSTSGTPHPPFVFRPGSVSIQANERFSNTDFERLLLAVGVFLPGGPATVFAACGFSVSTAVFNLREYIQGNANGGYNWSWNDSTSGGCSNLVAHRQWSAYGSSN